MVTRESFFSNPANYYSLVNRIQHYLRKLNSFIVFLKSQKELEKSRIDSNVGISCREEMDGDARIKLSRDFKNFKNDSCSYLNRDEIPQCLPLL